MQFEIIGRVKSEFAEPCDPETMSKEESLLRIKPEYAQGLTGIEDNRFLQIIFYLHRSQPYNLVDIRRHGKVRGVFASRSPHRPSPIGVTTVELLEKKGSELRVTGLDAIDGTPILDIKPFAPPMDEPTGQEE